MAERGRRSAEREEEKIEDRQLLRRELGAHMIVNKWVKWSAGIGLVPIPMVDLAGITTVQLLMVGDLAKHYEIPFSKQRGKAILASLLGSVVPNGLGYSVASAFFRYVPGLGPLLGAITLPAFAAASTYAVGKVFIQHFESGGTFLDFEPHEVRAYFHQVFEEAKAAV